MSLLYQPVVVQQRIVGKQAKATVTWSPDLESSLEKAVHSFILYSSFSEHSFYLRNVLSRDDHTAVPTNPL